MSSVARYLTDVYDLAKRAEAIRWTKRLREDIRTAQRLGDAVLIDTTTAEYRAIKHRYNL